MPQSCANMLLHLIWSTKDRLPTITGELRPQLHAYMAELVRQTGALCGRVGGTADHVHLAITLSRTQTVAELINFVKSNSSRWMSDHKIDFAWQHGYASISVSPRYVSKLEHYIDIQEEHHRTRTFKDEYRAFLMLNEMPFDERHMWD